VLLLADEGHTDAHIAANVHVGTTTVERLRRRWVEGGLPAALQERPRPGGNPKLDGKQEALLVALACSEPPEDRSCWTMQLLAERLVVIGAVDTISDETVRRVLKKRPQTVAETALVSRDGWRRLRLADGRCARSVRRTL
jgi:transposase